MVGSNFEAEANFNGEPDCRTEAHSQAEARAML